MNRIIDYYRFMFVYHFFKDNYQQVLMIQENSRRNQINMNEAKVRRGEYEKLSSS